MLSSGPPRAGTQIDDVRRPRPFQQGGQPLGDGGVHRLAHRLVVGIAQLIRDGVAEDTAATTAGLPTRIDAPGA